MATCTSNDSAASGTTTRLRSLAGLLALLLVVLWASPADARKRRRKRVPDVPKLEAIDVSEHGAPPGASPVAVPEEPVPADTLGVPTPMHDPAGAGLERFHEALRNTEAGEHTARIAVFGASHVAADSFTKVLRHRLQARFGDGGSGFVVPAKPWRNYNHRDANIDYSDGWEPYFVSKTRSRDDGVYGLAGCSFESRSKKDYCRIETAKRSDFGREVSRYEVFFWKQPKGGDLIVKIDGKRKARIKTRSKEAGPGYHTIDVPAGRHRLELRPRGNGLVTLFGVALERDVPGGVVMDTMGINGARAATQLEWDTQIFADHLARRKPDLVILAYGTNATGDHDQPIETYERDLDLVINRVRSLTDGASCVFVGPSDRPVKVEHLVDDDVQTAYFERPRQADVIEVQRRVAARYGCAFWDMTAAMGGPMSMLRWVHSEPRLAQKDFVHMRRPGYARLADLFWDALMGPWVEQAAPAPAPTEPPLPN